MASATLPSLLPRSEACWISALYLLAPTFCWDREGSEVGDVWVVRVVVVHSHGPLLSPILLKECRACGTSQCSSLFSSVTGGVDLIYTMDLEKTVASWIVLTTPKWVVVPSMKPSFDSMRICLYCGGKFDNFFAVWQYSLRTPLINCFDIQFEPEELPLS